MCSRRSVACRTISRLSCNFPSRTLTSYYVHGRSTGALLACAHDSNCSLFAAPLGVVAALAEGLDATHDFPGVLVWIMRMRKPHQLLSRGRIRALTKCLVHERAEVWSGSVPFAIELSVLAVQRAAPFGIRFEEAGALGARTAMRGATRLAVVARLAWHLLEQTEVFVPRHGWGRQLKLPLLSRQTLLLRCLVLPAGGGKQGEFEFRIFLRRQQAAGRNCRERRGCQGGRGQDTALVCQLDHPASKACNIRRADIAREQF